jgi:hypothetical protein
MTSFIGKFLTTAPASKKIRSVEWEELSILCRGESTSVTGKIKVYRTIGTTDTFSYAITAVGNRLYLKIMTPSGETFADLSSMEAWLEIESTRATDIRTFVCDHVCHKSTTRVGWLNYLGGIDYYTFYGQTIIEAQVERSMFRRDLPIGFTVRDRSAAVLSSVYADEIEVTSDFETPATIAWLILCMASPEVWIIVDGVLVPIVVTSKTQIVSSSGLVQVKIKYKKATDTITQNG